MIMIYVRLIQKGLKTLEEVPASIRETVREIVDNAVGKGSGEE